MPSYEENRARYFTSVAIDQVSKVIQKKWPVGLAETMEKIRVGDTLEITHTITLKATIERNERGGLVLVLLEGDLKG